MLRGKFIVFEGLNGSGKGSQMGKLFYHISSMGKAVPIFSTGEPTKLNEWGEKAREMLKSDGDPYSNGLTAVKYFANNRLEHNKIFNPLLDKGANVMSDRYYHSNFAYQHAQGIPYREIAKANRKTTRPDLTLIFNATPEESERRRKIRDGKEGRKFESNPEFNRKVWENYMELGDILPELMGDESIQYIDSMGSIEETFEQIKEVYHSRFG